MKKAEADAKKAVDEAKAKAELETAKANTAAPPAVRKVPTPVMPKSKTSSLK